MEEQFLVFYPSESQDPNDPTSWAPLQDDFELYSSPVCARPYNMPNSMGVGHIFNIQLGSDTYKAVNCIVSKIDYDESDFSKVYPLVLGKLTNQGDLVDF